VWMVKDIEELAAKDEPYLLTQAKSPVRAGWSHIGGRCHA